MSSGARKTVAEIVLDADNRARVEVGARTLYHFWGLLQSHYRDVLLPPQRRTDGSRVAWQWSQEEGASLPTAEDLKKLRRRVSDAHRSLVDAWSDGAPGGLTPEEAEVARSRLGRVVANLVSLADRELLGFVAVTRQGLLLHSWGAEQPGTLSYPDEQVLSIRGRVRQGDSPVSGADVFLEDEDGRELDHSHSDSSGYYGFYKLKPGAYRVKANSKKVTFAPEGIPVEVSSASVEQADLVAEEPAAKVDVIEGSTQPSFKTKSKTPAASRRRPLVLWLALVLVVVAGGLSWLWWGGSAEEKQSPAGQANANKENAREGAPTTPSFGGPPNSEAARKTRRQELDTELSASRRVPRSTHPREGDDESLYAAFERADHLAGHTASEGAPTSAGPGSTAGLPSASNPEAAAKSKGADARRPGAESAGANTPASANKTAAIKPGARTRQVSPVPGEDGNPEVNGETPASHGQPKKAELRPAAPSLSPTPTLRPGQVPSPTSRPSSSVATPSSRKATEKSAAASSPETSPEPGQSPSANPPRAPSSVSSAEKSSESSDGPADAATQATPTPSAPPATSAGMADAGAPEPDARWGAPLRLDLALWQVRLFADAIVPTEPQAQPDSPRLLSDAQERKRRLRQQEQPAWLRTPRLVAGLLLRAPTSVAQRGLVWQSANPGRNSRTRTLGTRAELVWYGGQSAESSTFNLQDGTGATWARVRVTASGETSVQLREGMSASYVVGIENRTDAPEPDWRGWRWVSDDGGPLPDHWETGDDEFHPVGRLEVPLNAATLEAGGWRIRWMDTSTLWGVGGGFSLRTEAAVRP